MEIKTYFAQDIEGNSIPEASVYLYRANTTDLASGLEDGNGNPLPNPFEADENGKIQIAAPNGHYDLRISSAGRDNTIPVQFLDVRRTVLNVDTLEALQEIPTSSLRDGQVCELATGERLKWRAATSSFVRIGSAYSTTSMVDKLMGSVSPMGMYVRGDLGDGGLAVGIVFRNHPTDSDRTIVEYQFGPDDDGWWRHKSAYTGLPTSIQEKYLPGWDIVFNGSILGSNLNRYTTTVGDHFVGNIIGPSLTFYSYTDDRGGMWRFWIDGKSYDISTYRSAPGYLRQNVVNNLVPGKMYSIHAEFVGQDPSNPPSAGDARGWFYYRPDDGSGYPGNIRPLSPYDKDRISSIGPTQERLIPGGVMEFAMSIFEDGTSIENHSWVPSHSTTPQIVGTVERNILIDGVSTSPESLTDVTEIKNLVIEQSYLFKQEGKTEALGRLTTRHRVNHDGTVDFDYKIQPLVAFNVSVWYTAHLMPDAAWPTELVLNNGKRIQVSGAISGEDIWDFDITSAAFVGYNAATGYQGLAADVDFREMGALNFDTQQGLAPNRLETTKKFYWRASAETDDFITVLPSQTYTARIRWGAVCGIKAPNKLGDSGESLV